MKTNQTVAKRRIRRPATTLSVLAAAAAALLLAAVAGPALAQAPDGSRAKVASFQRVRSGQDRSHVGTLRDRSRQGRQAKKSLNGTESPSQSLKTP